jgi:undecaprenyl-diphosphatase
VPLYLGVSAYAFPSGHTVMSVVVYGFLATLVAPALSPRMRLVLYASIGLFVGGVAFSRLYLGAHWLADVIAGVGIAGTWIALLAIARRRHVPETVGDLPLGVLVAAVFTFAGSWHVYTRFHSDLERYALRAPIQYVAFQNWWTGAWHNLPARRIDLGGEREEPLNVQYAGDLAPLRQRLLALGWHEPLQLSAGTALRWLMPSPSVDQLPLLPKLHGGRLDALHLVYRYQDSITGATEHLVLRLWPTQVRLQPGDIPLWIGFVGRLRVWRLPLLSFIRSNGGHDSALELLEPAFPSQPVIREIQRAPAGQARQSPWGGRVLLVHL